MQSCKIGEKQQKQGKSRKFQLIFGRKRIFSDIDLASQIKKSPASMISAEKPQKSKFFKFCETDKKFPLFSFQMSLILLNLDKNCGSQHVVEIVQIETNTLYSRASNCGTPNYGTDSNYGTKPWCRYSSLNRNRVLISTSYLRILNM